jgi:hypothetical protein
VKDFASLTALSQAQGVAIDKVEGGTPDQKATARQTFSEIARKIIERS